MRNLPMGKSGSPFASVPNVKIWLSEDESVGVEAYAALE